MRLAGDKSFSLPESCMLAERQCKQNQRYLFAYEYFSEKAIDIWKSECINRCKDKEKGSAYERYLNWTRQENEIAVFTLYAYADLEIPKKFDIIFHTDNPKDFVRVDYELTQSIHEAWLPLDSIDHGHKHLCVFRFHKELPEILKTLHEEFEKFSTVPKGQRSLGFCTSSDFSAIKTKIEKLRSIYGDMWWKHDDGE
jgi:hypothetical protein